MNNKNIEILFVFYSQFSLFLHHFLHDIKALRSINFIFFPSIFVLFSVFANLDMEKSKQIKLLFSKEIPINFGPEPP